MRDFNEAVRVKPDDPFFLETRGLFYKSRAILMTAERDFAEAKRLENNLHP